MPRFPNLLSVVLLGAFLGACSDDHSTDETLILLDSASDEAFATFRADVAAGNATPGSSAAALVAPTPGQTVPATPFTFRWSFPRESPAKPHGVESGRFVWLELSGSGTLADAIDIVAITSTSYTPDADVWAKIAGGGTITAKIYTAMLDEGALTDGPFSSASVTFNVAFSP